MRSNIEIIGIVARLIDVKQRRLFSVTDIMKELGVKKHETVSKWLSRKRIPKGVYVKRIEAFLEKYE